MPSTHVGNWPLSSVRVAQCMPLVHQFEGGTEPLKEHERMRMRVRAHAHTHTHTHTHTHVQATQKAPQAPQLPSLACLVLAQTTQGQAACAKGHRALSASFETP
eukprot:scaffold657_cov16-Tisochrysis_lutea.AAC.1